MGQYYKIVNVKKKQYISPHKFGDGTKLMEFSMSANGVLTGLGILLADGNGRGGGDLNSDNPIVGSWAGDNIVITGDYADNGKFVKDIHKNLYSVAGEEGKDISLEVLDALFDDTHFFNEFSSNMSFLDDDVIQLIKKRKQSTGAPISHKVVNSDGNTTYDVIDMNDGTSVWTCTCKAFQYSKELIPTCKHIKQIKP
jgi:hypothetical protein